MESLIGERNRYLATHAKAKGSTAERKVRAKISPLKAEAWLRVECEERTLKLVADQEAREQEGRWTDATSSKQIYRRQLLPNRWRMTATRI